MERVESMGQRAFVKVSIAAIVGLSGALAAGACSASEHIDETPGDVTSAQASSTAAPTPTPIAVGSSSASFNLPDTSDNANWRKPNPNGKNDGLPCTKPDDCKSGVCEGQGCESGAVCVSDARGCTRDLVSYCGCDKKTFGGSGSCAGRPYISKGACPN